MYGTKFHKDGSVVSDPTWHTACDMWEVAENLGCTLAFKTLGGFE